MNDRLDTEHVSWKNVEDPIKRASKMITDHQRFLNEVKITCRQGLQEIQEKQTKIEYARTCDNYLLSKTIDARGLTININELTKHHFDLITSARSSSPHQTFFSRSSTHKRLPSPTSSNRFIRSYDQIELADQYQRAQELLSDFEDILVEINGDFLAKEERFRSETPICVHVEYLPIEFTYTRILTTTRRKIEALLDNLNNDPVVVDIMDKSNHLQTLAHDKDEHLKENRLKWKDFKRQLEDLEQAAERFTTLDDLLPRTVYSKSDAHRDQILFEYILDEFQTLFKSTMDLADQFSDDTSQWLFIDHRLQSIKENFQFLFPRKNREHRKIK
ncbi:unnamed protein product, partial [Rotaria sordida]